MKTLGDLFRNPHAPLPIQYAALRAHFVDGLDPEIVADRFGYSAGTFRNLCSRLRKNPNLSDFFAVRKTHFRIAKNRAALGQGYQSKARRRRTANGHHHGAAYPAQTRVLPNSGGAHPVRVTTP